MEQRQPKQHNPIPAVAEPSRAPDLPPPPMRYTSEALFQDGREVLISHAGQEYRLRITRQNRLILTK